MKPHPRILELEDRIDLYVKGALTQAQIDDLWVDVIQSGSLDYMKTVATVRKLAVGRNATPIPLVMRPRTRMVAAAAAAAVVISIGTSLYYLSGPTSDAAFAPLSKIEYSLLRSSQSPAETFERSLEAITVIALDGDVARAESQLLALLQEPMSAAQNSVATLHLAALRFNQERFDEAIVGFDAILASDSAESVIREKAAWYAANARLRQGRETDAEPYLRIVIQSDGAYRRAAMSAQDHLRRP